MSRLPFLAAVLGCALVAAASYGPRADFAAAEQARIRAHLDSVERELRVRDVATLTLSERAARLRNLDVLHGYWVRGVFPQNTDFPGQRVPYFIDRFGTRCAMAYVIEQSDGGDLVTRVAATHNNARILELKHDPELVAWLADNGLTLAEAARIQPSYDRCGFGYCPSPVPLSSGYKNATAASIGADVVSVALNAVHTGLSRPVSSALGIVSGLAGIAIGAPNFDESGSRRTLGFVNAGVGAASAGLGVYRLAHRSRTQSRLSFGPWLDRRGGAGMSAQVRF